MARARGFDFVTLLSLGNTTTSTQGAAQDLQKYISVGQREMKFLLNVVSIAGTSPTIDVVIEESNSTSTGWTALGTFTQATTNGQETIHAVPTKRYIRAASTHGGTSPVVYFAVHALGELRIK